MTHCHHTNTVFSPYPRLIFLSGAPPESAGPGEAPNMGQVSEEAAEALREQIAAAAASAARQRKDEKKAKKRDQGLGNILLNFIRNGQQDDPLVLLLTRLLKLETPIVMILAMLSIKFTEILPLLSDHLEEEEAAGSPLPFSMNDMALTTMTNANLPAISDWAQLMLNCASYYPKKTLQALVRHHGVEHAALQLSAMLLEDFFKLRNQETNFENTKEFCDLILKAILKRIHKMADEQGLLDRPKSREEDED